MPTSAMTPADKQPEVDMLDASNSNALPEKELVAVPVTGYSSGEGLPYAPEDWPLPGDKCGWRVGNRRAASGHWHDRYFFLPSRYLNSAGKRIVFQSKLSLEEYIRKEFPATNVVDFYSSFIWKIPCSGQTQREEKVLSSFTSRRRKDANKHSGSESTTGDGDCKAGNRMCNLNMNARSNSLAAKACDICCTEDGFCGNCSCILCSQSIDWAYGGYSYIKCEAALGKKHICGHVAHIGCALRTNLAGTIEGNISLDLEYYCRRCDNRTDLISHVCKLIKTCESLDSNDEILPFADESLKDHVQFSPEISVCSSTKSAELLLEGTSHFVLLIQKSLKMLTSADEVFQRLVKRSDPIPCVGLVFVSPQVGIRLHKLFNVLATDIRSYDMERKTSTIDYDLLMNGDLSETRFVLGKVIMDTMEGEHSFTREQNLETKAKKSSLHDLTWEEDKNLIVEESPLTVIDHEHILNMATVEESRLDKSAQQNNRNVSSAEKNQFLEIINEWNKKVPAAQSHGNYSEKNQSFDAEKETDKPSGKKNQKMVVTKGHNHNGEHNRKNGAANKSRKPKRRSNKKASAENQVCKISGEKNQISVAKEKINGKMNQNVRPLMRIPLKKLTDEQNLKATSVEKRRPLSALFK